MSRYRKIDVRIWNDAKFRRLSDDGKIVFMLLLTHPSMTALGAMRASEAGLAADLGWLPERLSKGFAEALSEGMAEYDPEAAIVALPNFLKYNQPESPNVVKAWASALDLIPEGQIKDLVIQRSKAFLKGKTKAFMEALPKAFMEALPKPMPNQEQEPEQEQEQEPQEVRYDEGLSPTHVHARETEPNIMTMPMKEAEAYLASKQQVSPSNAYAAMKGGY